MKFLLALIILFLSGCGSSATEINKSSGAEVVVHYNGVEVMRKNSKYLGEHELRSLLKNESEDIIIFGAEWCRACKLTRRAISQANLKINVHYLNLEEKWVMEIAQIMGIKKIPFMLHLNKKGDTVSIKTGPGQIVTYLVVRF